MLKHDKSQFEKCGVFRYTKREAGAFLQMARGYRPEGDISVLELLAKSAMCDSAFGD